MKHSLEELFGELAKRENELCFIQDAQSQKMEKLKRQIEAGRVIESQLKDENQRLKESIVARESVVAELENAVEISKAELMQLQAKLVKREGEMRFAIQAKDLELQNMRGELEHADAMNDALEMKVQKMDEKLNRSIDAYEVEAACKNSKMNFLAENLEAHAHAIRDEKSHHEMMKSELENLQAHLQVMLKYKTEFLRIHSGHVQ